ncbi:MAG: winged helix-turn-helix transcriptional regulator [Caldilineaceae bacterium]|nr:winged helix-turn-helix transcriptional regulator [Caldilineaceae bacterium]
MNRELKAMTDEKTKPQMSRQIDGTGNAPSHTPADDSKNVECAHIVFDVVPQVMQSLRAEMRRQRGPDLSVLQLRALAFLRNNPGATLSHLAEHVGLTLPSMSSQVSGLVSRDLIDRATAPEDRRYVTLKLTEQGESVLDAARQSAQENLAMTLSVLSSDECVVVIEAMHLLARVFAPPSPDCLPDEASTQSSEA